MLWLVNSMISFVDARIYMMHFIYKCIQMLVTINFEENSTWLFSFSLRPAEAVEFFENIKSCNVVNSN